MFGVFILKANKWELHMESPSRMACAMELDYLVNSLGVRATIFKRV